MAAQEYGYGSASYIRKEGGPLTKVKGISEHNYVEAPEMVKLQLLFVGLATVGLVQTLHAGSPLRMAGLHCHGNCYSSALSDPYSDPLGGHDAALLGDETMVVGNEEQFPLGELNPNVSHQSARITAAAGDDTLGNVIDNISIHPARWTKMRYGPVQFSIAIPSSEPPTAIRFWHNGQAAHPDFVLPQSEWEATVENDTMLFQRSFVWSSPQLGKSNLQVEIKVGNRWSRLSRPLQLEIVPPQKPLVVAVGTLSSQLLPWDEKTGVIPCDSQLLVQLANLPAGAQVLADITGYGSLVGTIQSSDVVAFDLSKAVTSGRYRIALRYAGSQATLNSEETIAAAMTGERSAPLWVDFYNPQQQISVDNEYAKIHHQTLNAWLAATTSDPMAAALSQMASEIGRELTTNSAARLAEPPQPPATKPPKRAKVRLDSAPDENVDEQTFPTRLTTVKPQEPVLPPMAEGPAVPADGVEVAQPSFDMLIDKQIAMLNAIERVKQWKAVREQVRHAISSGEYVTDVAFDTPVTFPRRTYGPGAQEHANGGLTILEGMQLKVAANGDYCLSFSYVPPPVPCTVNLQLQFMIDADGPWHSLTIAPMTLKSVRELDQPSNEVTHVVQGHSATLARAAGDIVSIRRRGAATFGFGHKILQSGQNY